MRWVTIGLPLAALACYAVLALLFYPRLAAETGGLLPFDMRITGYSAEAARAYLAAMTPAGRALYLGPIRVNDTILPILFTLTFCLPLRRRHWAWSVPALLYGLSDLAENWAVARLIATGPQVDDGSIALASSLTMLRSGLVVLALLVALAGLWWNRAAGRRR